MGQVGPGAGMWLQRFKTDQRSPLELLSCDQEPSRVSVQQAFMLTGGYVNLCPIECRPVRLLHPGILVSGSYGQAVYETETVRWAPTRTKPQPF